MKKAWIAILALCALLAASAMAEGLTFEDESAQAPAPQSEVTLAVDVTETGKGPATEGEDAGNDPAQDPLAVNLIEAGDGQAAAGTDQAQIEKGKRLTELEGPVPSVIAALEAQKPPLAGVKIGIDPGHQAHGNSQKETVAPNSSKTKAKVSSGTAGVSTRIPEYVTVLEISLKLRQALESQGAEVYMTRENHDVDISNQERAQMMNELGVDLVLRIHCDGAESRSKRGIALYCSRSNDIAEESCRACEAILPALCEATGAKDNGIVSNDNYTGQNWSTVPCLMVECGFMSNPEEDVLLNDEDYQWKLAAGMTNGIIDYIEQRDAGER